MNTRKSLLACCALVGLLGCQDAETDPSSCGGAKCDDLGQSSVGQLMPRAPGTPGNISISRNQDAWLFEVIGAKGEIVLLSDSYAQRNSAVNGILSAQENGVLAERYEVEESAGGWGFTLSAANGEQLGDSQTFATEAEAENAAIRARDLLAGIVQYRAALATGAQFDLDRDSGDWEFALRDEEGELLLQSQRYSSRTDALTGIASVRNNGKSDNRYEILDSPPRFILKAANGEEIAESGQSYANREAAQAAATSTQALLTSERVANPW